MPSPSVDKAAHSGFETRRRRHQKVKTGVSVTLKTELYPPKIVFKLKKICLIN